jgi:hypothetical protein
MKRRLVGGGGFEPPKAKPADLQSAPFDHFGIHPFVAGAVVGIRTRDLILTMDALYQLSYDGISRRNYNKGTPLCED